jgi:hypothetical protein
MLLRLKAQQPISGAKAFWPLKGARQMADPFVLSIEPTEGQSFVHGFHLGTQEPLARQIAEERFHARNKAGMWTRTVALMRSGRMVDCYDGRWSSAYSADD